MLKVRFKSKEGYKEYDLHVADNFFKRALGLMFRDIGKNEGMIFYYKKRKLHIHTFFMRFPIDVIFLLDNRVVEVVRDLKPWRTYKSKVYSNSMIEIRSDDKLEISVGDKIEIRK
ncbi:MAG TPA: DUF192 domain-containing protein [Methanothermococcus okinawensis]|uniref:DUF192 domain-containing protein n=1 Tax=Methanofervidicoccus abyssi TaxID=2082189 RepID=A0A401HQG6_9EURY|nr:DUF192 domain-containing protein [Methanofervidicoccus abyssi]GBF36517.1 conserved hypothetical protein [Methanofervidicoccus abyssi]HIP15953.1 DUF192 domain-containing protein [Methanothermococcus okinawensis]HIP34562.1 DUF192 domain-containing protein [Methanothermococcus okinawensis]